MNEAAVKREPLWTAEEDLRLVDMRRRHKWEDISKALGRSIGGCAKRYHRVQAGAGERPNLTPRTCLRCGDDFNSWGPGNRRCPKCQDYVNHRLVDFEMAGHCG